MLGVLGSYKRQLGALFGMSWWDYGNFEYPRWRLFSIELVGWLFRTSFLFFFFDFVSFFGIEFCLQSGEDSLVLEWNSLLLGIFILTEGLRSPFVSFSWELSHALLAACWSEGQCGDSSFLRNIGLENAPGYWSRYAPTAVPAKMWHGPRNQKVCPRPLITGLPDGEVGQAKSVPVVEFSVCPKRTGFAAFIFLVSERKEQLGTPR